MRYGKLIDVGFQDNFRIIEFVDLVYQQQMQTITASKYER
jgi:hypothetical protein